MLEHAGPEPVTGLDAGGRSRYRVQGTAEVLLCTGIFTAQIMHKAAEITGHVVLRIKFAGAGAVRRCLAVFSQQE